MKTNYLLRLVVRTVAPFVTILVVAAGQVSATAVLDQSFDAFAAGSTGGPVVSTSQYIAQSFTVGLSGTLAQVDLQVQQLASTPTDDLLLSILGTSAGVPDINQVLGITAIPPGDVPPQDFNNVSFVSIDVSPLAISVSPGDVLGLELSYPTGTGGYFWYEEGGDLYAGGREFIRLPPNPFEAQQSTNDLGFQTWVEPIPEPGTVSLFCVGAFGAALILSRQKARSSAITRA